MKMKSGKIWLSGILAGILLATAGCDDPTKNDDDNGGGGTGPSQPEIITTFSLGDETYGYGMDKTDSGNFITAGYVIPSQKTKKEMFLAEISPKGEKLWSQTYGTYGDAEAHDVVALRNGGSLIAGAAEISDVLGMQMYLAETDNNGRLVWSRAFGGSGSDGANAVAKTADRIILAGWTDSYKNSPGYTDMFLTATDLAGNPVWPQPVAFGGPYSDSANDVVPFGKPLTEGYLAVGRYGTNDLMTNRLYVVMTDVDGKKKWERKYGSGSESMIGYSVREIPDSGFVITGVYNSDPLASGDKLLLMKIDYNGNIRWKHTYGECLIGYSLDLTDDGGFIVTGSTVNTANGQIELCMLRTDADGKVKKASSFPVAANPNTVGTAVRQSTKDDFVAAGYTMDWNNKGKMVFVNTSLP